MNNNTFLLNSFPIKAKNTCESFCEEADSDVLQTYQRVISDQFKEKEEDKKDPEISQSDLNYGKSIPDLKNFFMQKFNADRFMETVSWQGYIESISEKEKTIYGRMRELYKNGTEESIEFDFNDVSDDDKELVKIGAIFYYSIGYALKNGQRIKMAILRFKRNVKFSGLDVDNITDNAHKLSLGINWK